MLQHSSDHPARSGTLADGATLAVYADADAIAAAVAQRWLHDVEELLGTQDAVHCTLTGGSLGLATTKAVGAVVDAHPSVDWSRVHLWWSDERFVSPGDPDRLDEPSIMALRQGEPGNRLRLHPAPADTGQPIGEAAAVFAADIAHYVPSTANGTPCFDILIMGMGPDGHLASLFPDHDLLDATGVAVSISDSPKPPLTRLTMTLPVLNAGHHVWFVVAGADKAPAVAAATSGTPNRQTPASLVHGAKTTVWFVDEAAAPR